MNILQAEDLIKGLPDQALMQEAQAPSGQVPQYLVVSEIQRRTDMRKRYQEQQQPQGTVADQIVQEAAGGIASMPPQGMPPQGMPPQGMPPQGAPQQAMPPQAMPPQQMFSGGIIRLQEGGSTSMPGAGALEPIMYAIQEKAKDIARITGRKFEEVYEILLRQAQEQNPDYSMIAPAGLGISMDDLPSLPDLGQTDVALPARRRGEGVDSARESYTPQEINLPSGTNFLSSIAEGMRQTPLGEYSRAAEQGIMDVYERDGLAAAIGEAGRAGLGGLLSFGETVAEGYRPAAKAFVGGVDYLTRKPAEALDQFFTGSIEDPLTLGDIFGGEEPYPLQEVTVDAKARESSPEMKALLEAAKANTEDASSPATDDKSGAKNKQGTSPRQRQALPPPPSGVDAPPPPDGVDALDFSDLVADAKKAGMANALIQLGAGIAGGDLSKGISAAGIAATKGQQAAKDLAIKQRLATYAAGREDQAREEKKRQFDEQMDLLESKVEATLTASSATSQRENLRALAGEVASLRENLAIMTDAEKARFKVLEAQLYSMLGIDMPKGGVNAGIPTGESGVWGIAGR